jgi:hypothetical protein
MKSSLDNLITYIGSTADSDQSGDYDGMIVGEKRSFENFVAAELDNSDQPKTFAALPTTFLMRLGSTKGCCDAQRDSSGTVQ